MSEVVIRTTKLSKRFGDFMAVDGLDLTVRQGEVFGFLGPNGAGKTTTIGIVLGLVSATAGQVEVFGQTVTQGQTGALRRVGSLVGAPGMVPHMSGHDNLRLLARLHSDVDNRRVEEVLEQMDLTQAAGRKVGAYSTGMKQRLGLAAAILHRPALLILDEPTNGLDPAGMREIRELIRRLADDGMTVFLSSHLLHEIEQVCDRVAVINRGKLVREGTVNDLLSGEKSVKVRVPAPNEAAAVLQSLAGISEIQPNGSYVHIKGVASEEIIVHLVSNGIVPSEVTSGPGDLESVFLTLTQEAV